MKDVTQEKNKSKHFWQVVKPFMTNNIKNCNSNITLYENDTIISNASDVANVFNKYFINVANDFSEPDVVKSMSVNHVNDHYKDHLN